MYCGTGSGKFRQHAGDVDTNARGYIRCGIRSFLLSDFGHGGRVLDEEEEGHGVGAFVLCVGCVGGGDAGNNSGVLGEV
jgi:hypothetical protein